MLTHDEAMAVCERVIELADDDAEVTFRQSSEALLRIARNEAVQHTSSDGARVSLRLRRDGQLGEATVQARDETALQTLVQRAVAQLEMMPADPSPLSSVGSQPLLAVSAWYATGSPAGFDAARRVVAAEAMVKPIQAAGLTAAGAVEVAEQLTAKATSNGARMSYRETSVDLSVTAMGETGSGQAAGWSRSPVALDPAALGARAAEVAGRAQAPEPLEPGSYRVVLAPAAVATLLSYIGSGFNARAILEHRSWLDGLVGEQVLGPNVTLRRNPAHPRLQMCPFDDDGGAVEVLTLVEGGVAKELLHDRRTAAEMDAEPTGYASGGPVAQGAFAGALVVEADGVDEAELLAACGDGIYVSRLWYTNWVDPRECVITGMTRDGTFRIRHGELAEPVNNLRFNQNLRDLLSRVVAFGQPEAFRGTVTPAIVADGFWFTSGTRF